MHLKFSYSLQTRQQLTNCEPSFEYQHTIIFIPMNKQFSIWFSVQHSTGMKSECKNLFKLNLLFCYRWKCESIGNKWTNI